MILLCDVVFKSVYRFCFTVIEFMSSMDFLILLRAKHSGPRAKQAYR